MEDFSKEKEKKEASIVDKSKVCEDFSNFKRNLREKSKNEIY
jgi:hypothetical protein